MIENTASLHNRELFKYVSATVTLMQKRQLSNENGWRLYLTPDEYQTLIDLAPRVGTHQDEKEVELFIRLGGESGLRGEERITRTRRDLVDPADPSLDAKFIEIYGKDSTGEHDEGKYRKSILTRATVACIDELLQRVDRGPDDPLIDISEATMYRWTQDLGDRAAAETGKEDFRHLSPHDLRAYFATNCLVRHDMNMETVMTVGGWTDYDTMKRYLSLTSDETVVRDFQEADLLEGVGWDEYAPDTEGDEIYTRLGATTPMGAAAQLSALGADQMASRVSSLAADAQSNDGNPGFGRFTAAETETARRAAKFGAVAGLVGGALTTSVPALQSGATFPAATAALLLPLAVGWHRTDG